MKKTITCIICPRGCRLTAEIHEGTVSVSGNLCKRGAAYAVSECTAPTRTLTAVMRVNNRPYTMVSVRTSIAIPKESMTDAMAALRSTAVAAPIRIGDILLHDIFGADIVATCNIP